ncbi:MAG TPA: hypothetical protein EYO39_09635 [Nitrospirales bacterium]|nr:hypothetical protein [Nitrospirales bacterium]HIN33200.1 hypothetical protein [Nitrospirales bacterium]
MMTVLIILFGALSLLAGIVIVIKPDVIFGVLRNHVDKLELHILAIVVRLILGVLLIVQSNASKFPLIIEIIGWIAIVAALCLTVMGRRNFKRLMSWALSFVKRFGRVGGVIAATLYSTIGAFLIYAFV